MQTKYSLTNQRPSKGITRYSQIEAFFVYLFLFYFFQVNDRALQFDNAEKTVSVK